MVQILTPRTLATLDDAINYFKDANCSKATDLDESLVSLNPMLLQGFNDEFGWDMKPSEWVVYNIIDLKRSKDMNLKTEDVNRVLRKIGDTPEFLNLRPYKLALDILRKVGRRAGVEGAGHILYDVFVITSRCEDFYHDNEKKTRITVNNTKLSISPNHIIFNPDKAAACTKPGVNVGLVIEDNPEQVLHQLEDGIYVIMPERPWNTLNDVDSENLHVEDLEKKTDLIKTLDTYLGKRLYRVSMEEIVKYG